MGKLLKNFRVLNSHNHIKMLLLFFVIGCTKTNKGIDLKTPHDTVKTDTINYGKMLIENDFLKYADSLKIDSLKSEIKDSFMIYDENTYKFTHIDAEELTDYSFDVFVPQLNKMLAKRNIKLIVKPDQDYQISNNLLINGEKINLLTYPFNKYQKMLIFSL